MATRNRTLIYKRYRDALKSVRAPTSSSAKTSGNGPVIELVSSSLLNQNRSYAPLSTDDPSNSRLLSLQIKFHVGNFEIDFSFSKKIKFLPIVVVV